MIRTFDEIVQLLEVFTSGERLAVLLEGLHDLLVVVDGNNGTLADPISVPEGAKLCGLLEQRSLHVAVVLAPLNESVFGRVVFGER